MNFSAWKKIDFIHESSPYLFGSYLDLETRRRSKPTERKQRLESMGWKMMAHDLQVLPETFNLHLTMGPILFEGFLSISEYRRETVGMCYLPGCVVAHCGGVILQRAGRLTLPHRERWRAKDGRPSLTLSWTKRSPGEDEPGDQREIVLDRATVVQKHARAHIHNPITQIKMSRSCWFFTPWFAMVSAVGKL